MDIKNFSDSDLDLQTLKSLSPIFSDYFPDVLSKMFIININAVLKLAMKGLMSIMHPVTREKINIIGKDKKEILEIF